MYSLRLFLRQHYILSNIIVFLVLMLLIYWVFVKNSEIDENSHSSKKRINISLRRFYIGLITAFVIPLSVNFLSAGNLWQEEYAENIYNTASELYDNKEYSAALIQCDKLIEIDPDNPQYYLLKGNVFFKILQYDNAYESYSKAKWRNSKEALYYAKCGLSLIYSGKTEEGAKEMDIAIQMEPQNSTFLHEYGKALHYAGLYKEACEKYNLAMDINRNNNYENYGLMIDYAKTLCYIEDYNSAMELYAKVYENTDGETYYDLFLLSRYKRDNENSDDPDFHNRMGQALEFIGKYRDALEEYNLALEIDPDGPAYYLANLVDRMMMGEVK